MPQGDKRGATYEFYDWNYDGEWRGDYLTNGLGSLTDGNLGPQDYKLGYYAKSKTLCVSNTMLDYIATYILFHERVLSFLQSHLFVFRSWLGWVEEREKRICRNHF